MEESTPLKVGTQIIYVPEHVRSACGNNMSKMIAHQDAEFGFVSSWNDDTVFCRFWSNHFMGALRTLANSEGCNRRDLELHSRYHQAIIDVTIKKFRAESERFGWHEQEAT